MDSDATLLDQDQQFSQRRIEAGGAPVDIHEAGDGLAVIYVGAPDDGLAALLAQAFRIVATSGGEDFPGLSMAMKARRLASIAGAAGHEQFCLCASGEDAAAVLHLAADRPEAVQRCVLVAPGVYDGHGVLRDPSLADKLEKIVCHSLALFGTDGGGKADAVPSFYRAHIPNCHLMYVFDAPDIVSDRPDAAASVIQDFLRRGDGFLVSDQDGRVHR